MASIKAILWTYKKNNAGTYSIAIRITKNRKPQYVHTGFFISEKHWDAKSSKVRKSHPNASRLNNLILKKLSEAQDTLLEEESNDNDLSAKEIKKKIKRENSGVYFFEQAAERIKSKFMEKKFSVAKSELSFLFNIHEFVNLNPSLSLKKAKTEIKDRKRQRISQGLKNENFVEEVLKAFSKDHSLLFQNIDLAFIKKLKNFCISHLELKTRSVTNHLIFIRTLYNTAIKENLIDDKNYPFGGDKEKIRYSSGNKIGLSLGEIMKIEQLKLKEDTATWLAKQIYLFSYYFAGIRISDVLELKWSDFMDGRLYYQMNKNEKPVSLKVPDKAQNILNLFMKDKKNKKDYVFPFLKQANPNNENDLFRKTRNATKLINKHLKKIAELCKIDKSLSNHIARHSFGNIAGDKIHPRMLQKLYRHTDLKTTIGYQANFIHKEADDALDSVLNS